MDLNDLRESQAKANRAASETIELKAALKQLEGRVDRLGLTVRVLKELFVAGNPKAEEAFMQKLQQVVAELPDKNNCHKCGKPMGTKHTKCMYCGEARPVDIF